MRMAYGYQYPVSYTHLDVYKRQNQYRKTRSQLMKLAAEPGEDAQAQALEAVAVYTLSLIHI